jgi:hypothetical protein
VDNEKQHPLKLSLGQIALRDIAIRQTGGLLSTLERLDRITREQSDKEVIIDVRNDLKNRVDLRNERCGTSPIDPDFTEAE